MHKFSNAPGSSDTLQLSPALRADMESKNIDIALSLHVLQELNKSLAAGKKNPGIRSLPALHDKRIVHLANNGLAGADPLLFVEYGEAAARLARFGLQLPEELGEKHTIGTKGCTAFSRRQLLAIGEALLPFAAYGVLNGGSATSYADEKKNQGFSPVTFEVVQDQFERLAPLCRGLPKGSAPAFVNPDGSPGPSFLELKMRHRLLAARAFFDSTSTDKFNESSCCRKHDRYVEIQSTNKRALDENFLPLYQMTSHATHEVLAADYRRAEKSDYIRPLAASLNMEPSRWESGIQPLICAYTHSSEGEPRRIFDRAFGGENSSLPLPGGHGQCFKVLKEVFSQLRNRGIRYACLGNVDNLGYTIDPVELAVIALTGSPAGFEFSRRSALDLKGGVLAEDENGRWTVADIGPAISFEELLVLEKQGGTSLFNCATGIFDLDYLVPRIDEIAIKLPLRTSDQDKDSGKYSQVEQVAWEVMGLLPDFTVFSVEKRQRFLAAKHLIDTILTSGLGLSDPRMPASIGKTASDLNQGLAQLLGTVYGLKLCGGRWLPEELV